MSSAQIRSSALFGTGTTIGITATIGTAVTIGTAIINTATNHRRRRRIACAKSSTPLQRLSRCTPGNWRRWQPVALFEPAPTIVGPFEIICSPTHLAIFAKVFPA
jgi:hypothetical protein